ncbi:MAG: hypothetical protein U1E28_02105 [Beijerinckiaceae bacterium]
MAATAGQVVAAELVGGLVMEKRGRLTLLTAGKAEDPAARAVLLGQVVVVEMLVAVATAQPLFLSRRNQHTTY